MQQAEAPAAEAAMEPAGWECEVDGTWLAYPGACLARAQASRQPPRAKLGKPRQFGRLCIVPRALRASTE